MNKNSNLYRSLHKFLLVICFIITILSQSINSHGDDFKEQKSRGIAKCDEFSRHDYQTGLIFNPSGYQTFYLQSECFQKLAVEVRDISLCSEVQERKSWFFNGSAVSEERCIQLVKQLLEKDQSEAARIVGIHKIAELHFARNANGRDVDLRVVTRGSFWHKYKLLIECESASGSGTAKIYEKEHTLGQQDHDLNLFIPIKEISQSLEGGIVDKELSVHAMLELTPSTQEDYVTFNYLSSAERESRYETKVNFFRLER